MKRRPCERCKEAPRVTKGRFCKECRLLVLRELADAGYLQRTWEPTAAEYERQGNWANAWNASRCNLNRRAHCRVTFA